jgi:hypothetical protein
LSNLFAIARVIVTGRSDNSSVRRHTSLLVGDVHPLYIWYQRNRESERPADASAGIEFKRIFTAQGVLILG